MRTALTIFMLLVSGCAPGEVRSGGDRADAALSLDAPPSSKDVREESARGEEVATAPADVTPSSDHNAAPDASSPARLGVVTREGAGLRLRTNPTVNYRFVDAAWDAAGRTCLVVYGNGPVGGAFLDEDGGQVGDGFRLTEQPHPGGPWSQLPRVAAGRAGFVVTWHVEVDRSAAVQARRVLAGGAFGGPAVLLGPIGSQQESPAAIAYAPEADEFLVVWAQQGLKGRRLDGTGAPRGEVLTLSTPGAWVEQPAVTWHAGARAFFVTYMQEMGGTRVNLQRVAVGTGAAVGAARSLSGDLEFAKITDVAYDARAGEVIAAWYAVRGGVRSFEAQRIRGDGEPPSSLYTDRPVRPRTAGGRDAAKGILRAKGCRVRDPIGFPIPCQIAWKASRPKAKEVLLPSPHMPAKGGDQGEPTTGPGPPRSRVVGRGRSRIRDAPEAAGPRRVLLLARGGRRARPVDLRSGGRGGAVRGRTDAKPFTAEYAGFNVHAGVTVAAHDRAGRERLCRYIARKRTAMGARVPTHASS